ncbi:hypothetical protein DM02DRAFT_627206 [Periconia macrospinosa]|uniref:Uncharacterized protein n=1 Tax=Periconia macrospinosa TaxID=97972 RepID=A0A2V1DUJ0_9PLEO|nr:hypothetical protein DM02DRAFT_627206 [Periconia macrospinosa]
MPPKRKNKASKPFHSSPAKAAPAELASSKRRNSVQGGKTSRLAPSIALHMTTRRAAKTASVQTSSGAPSIASSTSRRSSLNDLAQFQDAHSDVDDEHERPAKRTRLSTDSGSPQPSAPSMVDQPPAVNAVDASQTPELHRPESHPPVNGAATSGKKRRASDGSSQSAKAPSARPNGVLTRTQSDVSEMQPRRKKRKTTQTPAADSADLPPEPELTDASTAPNSPEQIADVDSSQNLHHVLPTNGDAPTKLGKRMPGRRRAPHSDVNVETDLRRQLNLKMSYRSLAKVQKLILEELSNRAVRNLENDRDYYKRVLEYQPLMDALDQRKERRLAQLNALRKEKLDQLERVRIATEHIEREKYIRRFKDLQEDLLLQCYYRMKQIDREAKGREAAATDDEDNLVAATFMKFPTTTGDDRLGSKYASRSRAYVDTEEMLEEDMHRKRLNRLREEFVARTEEADDQIERLPFAAYNGQDRKEAVSHWNIMSLIDAANNVENAPPPPPPLPAVIPNEQADALFLLASLSADASQGIPPQIKEQPKDEPISAPLARQPSPMEAVQSTEEQPLPESTTQPKPVEQPIIQETSQKNSPRPEPITVQTNIDQPAPKSEAPARSTHRIMDMLNDESESPVKSQPAVCEQPPVVAPLKNGLDNHVHRYDPLQTYPEPPKIVPRLPEHGSWSTTRTTPSWNSRYKNMSEETLRKRDPMKSIRAMLDAKALSEGRIPPGSRSDKLENNHKAPMERDRSRDTAPLARPFGSTDQSEHSDHSGQDINKAQASSYTASPPAPPLSYNQSPRVAPSYPPPRSVSQETSSSQWPRDRRLSGSQAPRPSASPYGGSPPQPYHPEPSKAVQSHPPPHSHYSPTTTTQLPSISASLPQKPPGPPPSNPINFRFAHYDPAPQRPSSYPSPSPANYAPAPRPPHHVAPPPYTSSYNPPTSYHTGYVAPPGSFQAPPPPPPTAHSPYPPLKIHQYGGQPILPANMAPPPHHTQPAPLAFATQQPPQQPTYAPSAHQQQQQQPRSIHRRTPSYEQAQAPNAASSAPRDTAAPPPPSAPPETASRQRRQYRSYHTPGTQFRNYQGPAESGRRRGG